MQIHQRALRVVAAAGVTVFMAMGAVGPVHANEDQSAQTCDELGYTKPAALDNSSGSATFEWGSLEWGASGDEASEEERDLASRTLTYTINDGYVVDLCVKSGQQVGTKESLGLTGPIGGEVEIAQEISHVGYRVGDEAPAQEAPEEELPEETPEQETPEEETPEEEEAPEEEIPGEVTPGDDDEEESGEQPAEAEEECPVQDDMPAEAPVGDEAADEVPVGDEDAGDEDAGDAADEDDCVTVTPEEPEELSGGEAGGDPAEADRAPAEMSPTAGVLPDTGAGRYALPVIAGLALLGAGGFLLLRKRSSAGS